MDVEGNQVPESRTDLGAIGSVWAGDTARCQAKKRFKRRSDGSPDREGWIVFELGYLLRVAHGDEVVAAHVEAHLFESGRSVLCARAKKKRTKKRPKMLERTREVGGGLSGISTGQRVIHVESVKFDLLQVEAAVDEHSAKAKKRKEKSIRPKNLKNQRVPTSTTAWQ